MKTEKVIELRCGKCNHKLFDVEVQGEDDTYVLDGISIKCGRCCRGMTIKKYTAAMLLTGMIRKNNRCVYELK